MPLTLEAERREPSGAMQENLEEPDGSRPMTSTFVAEQRKLSGVFRILLGYTANQEPGGSRRTAKVDGIGR